MLAQTVERFLGSAPRAVRQAKALMLREAPLPPPEIEELTIRTIAEARASEEGQAGTAAFFAKVPPPWAPGSAGLQTGTADRREAKPGRRMTNPR